MAKSAAKKKTRKAAGKTARSKVSRAADRARVSRQATELAYVAKKFGVSKEAVLKAIAKAGNGRAAVYAALTAYKARSRAADRARISRQPHEVARVAAKFNVSAETVLAALDTHGSSRKKVEAALGAK